MDKGMGAVNTKVGKEEQNPLTDKQINDLSTVAGTIRGLTMDATQKANSGHPGMPMGCAELGAYLYGVALRHNPKNSSWVNRDRVILSAGHGSMWLYSLLNLSGFDLSLKEIINFRQLHSKTPGHPESNDTDGVETTTGPLGQGIGNAVGTALGLKILAQKFNTDKFTLFDSKVYTVVGDGCIMEGISSEVSSLAGHLKLDNLIVLYDANDISLDGPLSESCSEDTAARYQAYGWEVYHVDGHDLQAIHKTLSLAKHNQKRPVMIMVKTTIGKGSPNKAGTYKVHGSPLGEEEVSHTKASLGLPEESFFVPEVVKNYFKEKLQSDVQSENEWNDKFSSWSKENPTLLKTFIAMQKRELPTDLEVRIERIAIKNPIAGRTASNAVLNEISSFLPQLYGGSADLSCSDMTMLKEFPVITPGNFSGRNIKFGVREFGMAAMATGMAETGFLLPYVGTFLTFSDYMRNAIRLCSLMREHVIYQFTHDSIFLGEDGPTHQPVEHFAALRAIPNLHVLRPADANEVKRAWISMLNYKGPSAIILSRQNLPELLETAIPFSRGVAKGAYFLKKPEGDRHYTLVATGSEVSLSLKVAEALEQKGKKAAVISMPCWELLEQQSKEYKASLFDDTSTYVSIEAGIAQGWHKYIGREGIAISVETFGASAPMKDLEEEFGFTVDKILKRIL